MSFTSLESQPLFPTHDISSRDADLLELFLSNEDLFRNGHEAAESNYPAYKLGHEALYRVAAPLLDDSSRLSAFSHGISAYENISGLMRPVSPHSDIGVEQVLAMTAALQGDFVSISSEAREQFDTQLPHAAQVIAQTALRFHPHHTDYALSGAAIAARLELGNITL